MELVLVVHIKLLQSTGRARRVLNLKKVEEQLSISLAFNANISYILLTRYVELTGNPRCFRTKI